MTEHTENPVEDDAQAMTRDMFYVRLGNTLGASYDIVHQVDGTLLGGPMDEHSKININRPEDRNMIVMLDDMTLDLVDSLGDWMDEDDDMSALGVERDYYLGLEGPYLPRNGPMRTIGEIELVAGIWPRYFRNEDWNLNNRLDPNENDGAQSFPPDEPDGILDGAWSSRLTVYSVAGGATASGQRRIVLRDATAEELQERLGVDPIQAQALIEYGSSANNSLANLVMTPLPGATGASGQGGQGGNAPGAGGGISTAVTAGGNNNNQEVNGDRSSNQSRNTARQGAAVAPLSDQQLQAVLAETCIEDPLDRTPGKMNLNTISADLLRDVFDFWGLDEAIADEIIHMRSSRPEGILSIADLKDIPKITAADLQTITRQFDTVSNVFTITSRGRSWASGLEVEIVAVVDRSTVPVQIIEYREQ
jgi:DNA uptake protein ComE-like DNA-binding protein